MEIRGLLQNRRFVLALTCVGAFTLILLICNIFVIQGDEFFNLSNTLISPIAALSTCFLFYQASKNKNDANARFVWSGMAWGFGLWGLADVIWAFYSFALQEEVPYPSIADLAWVIGYIPLYYALVTRLRTLKVKPSYRQYLLIGAFSFISILLTGYLIILPVISDFDSSRLLEGFLNIAYPVGDVGLVILASLILILLKEGRFTLMWRLIFTGIFIMTVSDLLYCFSSWEGLYYPDGRVNLLTNLADTTYTLAYIIAGLGIYIYRFIWRIEKAFDLSIETWPAPRCHAFIGTNRDHELITVSNNFFCLVDGTAGTDFQGKRLDEVLGIRPEALTALIDRIMEQDLVCNEPLTIKTATKKEQREVWITAVGIFNPDREYAGANFALSAEVQVAEELRLPKNSELQGMLNYILSLAGSTPQDEILTIRTYFLEVIRLLSAMLYQFGGTQFRNALFEDLNRTIKQQNLPIQIHDQVITLPEAKDGKELADLLIPLLQSARKFTVDLIGEQIVKEDVHELEKPLGGTVLRDLDKYRLRVFALN